MANLDKNVNGQQVGRVLWYDPNYANNVMVNSEDLSIKVEFSTYRKGRTLVFNGQEVNNTGGESATVTFIEGSKVSNSIQPSLTTRYTDAVKLEVINNDNNDNNEDFESLGIESIDIEFNTAFQPMIKIKFIDVRGQAVLQQGNMSKYRMFFELPYPIYNLKVKGFYGGTVSYCLHMQRWNASFNSNTGNFEIQADFLGYTYALLTDMIMGLIRASVRTKKGQIKFEQKKSEYGENSNLVLTIDDMLKRLVDLNFSIKKISEDDDSAAQLQSFDEINDNISNIYTSLNLFSASIYDGETPYFVSNDNVYICVPTSSRNKYDKAYSAYTDTIKTLVSNVNSKISDDSLKLKENYLKDVVIIKDITKAILKGPNAVNIITNSSSGKYDGTDKSNGYINDMLSVIGTLGTSNISDDVNFDIYNLKRIKNHLDGQKKLIDDRKTITEEDTAEKLSDLATETLGFEPSIRNIFRVLCINTEIFLEVLREVSVESQGNEKRKLEFNKLTGNSLNIKKDDKNIYAWPEYREDKKDGNGYVETWLGSVSSIIPSNINEVVFVDEMHTELINVAKFDKELEEQISNQDSGLDIDKEPTLIENPWYPISVADTPVDPRMEKNPYITAIEDESRTVDSVQRLLLMRGFLLMGVSVFNNKIDNSLLGLMGQFEAENFLSACRKLGKEGQTLIELYLNEGSASASTYSQRVKEMGLNGSDKIDNPGNKKKKPIMVYAGADDNKVKTKEQLPKNNSGGLDLKKIYYKYTYIRDENTKAAYIPVNKNFSGKEFYRSNGDILTIGEIKNLSNDLIFVSNPINWRNPLNFKGSRFWEKDDGSLHIKLYELSDYEEKTMAPSFGSDLYQQYQETLTDENKALRLDLSYDTLVKNADNPDKILGGFQPYIGQYISREFSTLIYEDANRFNNENSATYHKWFGDPQWSSDIKYDLSTLAFYTQNTNRNKNYANVGTYLSKVIDSQLLKDKYGGVITSRTEYNGIPVIRYRSTLSKSDISPTIKSENTSFSNRQEWLDSGFYMKNKKLISGVLNKGTKVYLPFIEYGVKEKTISLFGSYFYYSQKSNEAKALLFLHSIPWQGVKTLSDDINEFFMLDKRSDWGENGKRYTEDNKNSTRVLGIRTLFQSYGGFVFVPKAWALFMGGILWRLRTNDAITYGNSSKTLIDPNKTPIKEQFLYFAGETGVVENFFNNEWFNDESPDRKPWGIYFSNETNKSNVTNDSTYVLIDKTIRYLPKQVRDEFVNYFLNWVESENGFKFIQKELEIVENTSKLTSEYNKLKNNVVFLGKSGNQIYGQSYISLEDLNNSFNQSVINNYDLLTPTSDLDSNFTTILKSNTKVMDYIVSLLTTQQTVIQNVNPNIWNYNPFNEFNGLNSEATKNGYEGLIGGSISPSKSIRVRGDKMFKFLDGFHNRLLKRKDEFLNETIVEDDEINQIEQEIFGTSDDKVIKLQIYRKLSAINDKWINGTPDGNIFSQCGSPSISESELKFVKKFRPSATEKSLIDTFKFVDRAFRDIGDKFYININLVSDIIRNDYNQSFFDVSNKILSNNNFNFIPLPNFINFNDYKQLSTIFTPYSYNNPITYDGTGPSFVCTYVGQSSVNLDLGTQSPYPDDGLSFNLDPSGNLVWAEEASDFNDVPNLENGDIYTPVFAVNYGQQNQNYFKNIKLDQREFAETMESLQIIEQISQTGDKSKPTFAGNNLFDVYQTRAYSAEVEMMGSAMIQPMMYFQLSNIPMFRGAYLIYKVNHKITPHSMVTTFKGNRAKKTKTPLLDKATMYMNLIGTQSGSGKISSRSSVSGNFPPIVQTIIENDGRNGSVSSGYITLKPVPFDKLKAVGDPFNKKNLKDENLLLSEAVEPLLNMLNDWTDWMSINDFKGVSSGNKKLYTYITSIFRDIAKQEDVKRQKTAEGRPKEAATPGSSPHGWAMAVDLQFFKKNGEIIANKNSVANKSFDINVNPAIKWLYDNSYKYGWILPYSLRDGAGTEEHWHWEYHGTAAKCLVEKNPNVYGYKMDTSGTIKNFVKNPKDSSGNEAVYTGCDYRYIKMGDGNDSSGGSVASKNPSLKCGKASANDVDSIYPKSKKWRNGPAEVIVNQTNGPTVSVKKLDYPQVKFETTIITPAQYVAAAEKIIDKLAPNATTTQKKLILVSAFAISKSEQGSGDGFKGFNNNISGVESDGFKVFNKNDVNGYVVATEGGTGKSKKYFSFSDLSSGLVPLISKIMERNMFDTGGGANEWAWRYFRDWNGFGARTKKEYSNNPNYNDCNIITSNESKYNSALNKVNSLTKYK
jgi:hypothetical protein